MKLESFLGYLFSSFAVMSGAAQTLAMESALLRYGTFAMTVLCAATATALFRKARHHGAAIEALNKLTNCNSILSVAPVSSEAELREVWRIDVSNFDDHFVPTDMGVNWWEKYPTGVYVLRKNGDLLGYVSFWPLSQKTFKEFVSGKRLETEISARCIVPPADTATETWWYIGSIALLARVRRTKAIKELVAKATMGWLSRLDPAGNIRVCALAYSQEGEKLLRRFGFCKFAEATESPHKLAVYVKESTVAGFLDALGGITERDMLHKKTPTTTRQL